MSTCSPLLKSQEVVELLGLLRLGGRSGCWRGTLLVREDPDWTLPRCCPYLFFLESQLDPNTVQTQDATVQLWLMLVLNVLLFEYLKEKGRKEREPASGSCSAREWSPQSPESTTVEV